MELRRAGRFLNSPIQSLPARTSRGSEKVLKAIATARLRQDWQQSYHDACLRMMLEIAWCAKARQEEFRDGGMKRKVRPR